MDGYGLAGLSRREEEWVPPQKTCEEQHSYTIASWYACTHIMICGIFNRTVTTNINEDGRYFENPTYEDTSTTLNLTNGSVSNEAPKNVNSSDTNYSTIHENGEDGPAYDILSRAQATGTKVASPPGSSQICTEH